MTKVSFSQLPTNAILKLKELIQSMRKNGQSWEDIKLLKDCSDNKDITVRFKQFVFKQKLSIIIGFTYEHWNRLVSKLEECDSPNNMIHALEADFIESNSNDNSVILSQTDGYTSWLAYSEHLKKDNNFSDEDIKSINKSADEIVKRVKQYNSPVKGMVVGNVQSGKTANISAVMAKCADLNTNLFIILTGNITSLRIQTQARLTDDLVHLCDIQWTNLLNELLSPNKEKRIEERLNFSESSPKRYFFCCLKNIDWLNELKRFLNEDLKLSKSKINLLLIDDEADLASLNGKDIKKEIAPISALIREIVNDNNYKSNNHFRSVAYIGYTATPYGNFLNEKSEDSLYPKDFICTLPPSPFYIGPKQLFGKNHLDIFNEITEEDLTQLTFLINRQKDDDSNIPVSLKKAIAWFCICLAIRRNNNDKKPTSMLIHSSGLTDDHKRIATSVKKWFEKITTDDFIILCRAVYKEQVEKMGISDFFECIPMYGKNSKESPDIELKDYPDFSGIESIIRDIHKIKLSHIKTITEKVNNRKKINNIYGEGIHLCIDNSVSKPIIEANSNENNLFKEGVNIRLVYPKDNEQYIVSPGFIVVGGNTLSRGITIEGLVSTYFARDVKTGDTLMQMGRWFGYRIGYELLPRIWITETAKTRFESLTEIDSKLRDYLKIYKTELSPSSVAPLIQCSELPEFRITSKNKSQSADFARALYLGKHPQAVTFSNDIKILNRNLSSADSFINVLDSKYKKNNKFKNRVIWEKVSQDDIIAFLKNYDAIFTDVGPTGNLIYIIKNLPNKYSSWNVVLSGVSKGDVWKDKIRKIERSKLKTTEINRKNNTFSIGTLSEKNSWLFDFAEEKKKQLYDNNDINNDASILHSKIRHENGVGYIPLMVIYCIDKKSRAYTPKRYPLDTGCDVLGVEVIIAADLNELVKREKHDYLQMNMEK